MKSRVFVWFLSGVGLLTGCVRPQTEQLSDRAVTLSTVTVGTDDTQWAITRLLTESEGWFARQRLNPRDALLHKQMLLRAELQSPGGDLWEGVKRSGATWSVPLVADFSAGANHYQVVCGWVSYRSGERDPTDCWPCFVIYYNGEPQRYTRVDEQDQVWMGYGPTPEGWSIPRGDPAPLAKTIKDTLRESLSADEKPVPPMEPPDHRIKSV